jgi:hypothetical protein
LGGVEEGASPLFIKTFVGGLVWEIKPGGGEDKPSLYNPYLILYSSF